MGLVVLIDRPGYRLAADRKVLKSSDAVVIESVAHAYARARERITAVLSDVERVCAKAAEDGYREGLVKAQEEAARRWTVAEAERRVLLRSMQPELANIVVDAITLLAKEIDRQAFFERALETLQNSLREARWSRLRVHPDDAEAAQLALTQFDRTTGLGKLARVVPDESLPAQGCVLESELGRVDASLGTQLESIRHAIEHAEQELMSFSG
jgi:type III secretion protein L